MKITTLSVMSALCGQNDSLLKIKNNMKKNGGVGKGGGVIA